MCIRDRNGSDLAIESQHRTFVSARGKVSANAQAELEVQWEEIQNMYQHSAKHGDLICTTKLAAARLAALATRLVHAQQHQEQVDEVEGFIWFGAPPPTDAPWLDQCAYWGSLNFLVGSIVFSISSLLVFCPGPVAHLLSVGCGIVGGLLFTVGSYFELESNKWRELPLTDMGFWASNCNFWASVLFTWYGIGVAIDPGSVWLTKVWIFVASVLWMVASSLMMVMWRNHMHGLLFNRKLNSRPTRRATMSRSVSYTHLRAHETPEHLVCRLLLEKKKKKEY
eukprot:TRINITY_DN10611_c0_g1_i2.p1 TRINITY_DN10611_c0_g1~~TRINITY_DN10611_c0_g1_i2.p1  ORF type:complete len:281 (-),score=58.19 TRINITY_DN10611_c0_g1_i2:47-889(-)